MVKKKVVRNGHERSRGIYIRAWVPPPTHAALKSRAQKNRRSIQSELLVIIEAAIGKGHGGEA